MVPIQINFPPMILFCHHRPFSQGITPARIGLFIRTFLLRTSSCVCLTLLRRVHSAPKTGNLLGTFIPRCVCKSCFKGLCSGSVLSFRAAIVVKARFTGNFFRVLSHP